jgi:gamma-glutamyltranspeptidase/glutathione hydrolase
VQATNTLNLESNLYNLVGASLQAKGHKVQSANGEHMGGLQGIWFLPAGNDSAPSVSATATEQPVAGVYRGASDHRKDGEAVGW